MPVSSYPYVDQSAKGVGMMKVQIWTDEFSGTIGRITVNRTGTGLDTDIGAVRLFVDTGADENPAGGNGTFEPAIDTQQSLMQSYAFHAAVEPAALAQPDLTIDRAALERSRDRHLNLMQNANLESLAQACDPAAHLSGFGQNDPEAGDLLPC